MRQDETLAWLMLADRLGMSLQRCQRETTSSEFVLWMAYLERDLQTHRREEYYWAQISADIRRSFAKTPRRIKLEDSLLNFSTARRSKRSSQQSASPAERLAASKAYWLGMLGLKRED